MFFLFHVETTIVLYMYRLELNWMIFLSQFSVFSVVVVVLIVVIFLVDSCTKKCWSIFFATILYICMESWSFALWYYLMFYKQWRAVHCSEHVTMYWDVGMLSLTKKNSSWRKALCDWFWCKTVWNIKPLICLGPLHSSNSCHTCDMLPSVCQCFLLVSPWFLINKLQYCWQIWTKNYR